MATYQPYGAALRTNDNGYPPPQGSSYPTNSTSTLETKVGEDPRSLNRTPSPTPSEVKELSSGAVDWKTLSSGKFWFRKEWIWYYLALVVILVISALVILYHKQIVAWLTPVTQWLHGRQLGWLVPIGVLFVISFPPLFGHEIVAILCGLVWGLWIGFGIVAAGTFLGEVGNFYAFKYCCRARGEKMEKTKIWYACLARVVREGGFKIALIARLSAIPGHFTTGVFSTCGMGIFVFSIAAILSLPKQFITVYLGVILAQSNSGVEDKKSRIISDVVLAITFIITIVAMWYIFRLMDQAKPQVIYQRRKARQAKILRGGVSPYSNGGPSMSSDDVFNPNPSDSDIPLTSNDPNESRYQQWDRLGKAVGYSADPNIIHSPKPQAGSATFYPSNYSQGQEPAGHTFNNTRHGREESTDAVGWDMRNKPSGYEVQQTPTQATYDLYDGRSSGHGQQPTDATYRTALSSSPVHDDDLSLPQHHHQPPGSALSPSNAQLPYGVYSPSPPTSWSTMR
ncbi:hypothetical protein B0H34DRAFT_755977 [Crassisporium funariophilum]|nr:hypothetical protein B0H34DRAFT_755977 [Crassisporium funariophilum]